jgi:hypothetical protein
MASKSHLASNGCVAACFKMLRYQRLGNACASGGAWPLDATGGLETLSDENASCAGAGR